MKPFARYIETDLATFKYAYGPSVASGKEFHPFYELLLFLEGDAELITENLHLPIKPDNLLLIPKETYHKLIIRGDPVHYRRCTLHFYDTEPLRPLIGRELQAPAVIETDSRLRELFGLLMKQSGKDSQVAGLLLNGALPLLLYGLAANKHSQSRSGGENAVLTPVLEHISCHLGEKLTLEALAKRCGLSASSLSHLFKKEMNISLHQYILKKRLITASRKIAAGQPATAAALECGFKDYSGFYKQYKKQFGFSPSEHNK